jgi:hypothetical protein
MALRACGGLDDNLGARANAMGLQRNDAIRWYVGGNLDRD